jgi:hypothetical protein
MTDKTSISTDSHYIVALGFWLPCGRGNFYRDSEDRKLLKTDKKELIDGYQTEINREKYDTFQSSVFSRYIRVFSKMVSGDFIPIIPELRRDKLTSDPEGLIFYSEDLTQVEGLKIPGYTDSDQPIKKIIFIFNDKGFNIIFAIVSQSKETDDGRKKSEKNKIYKYLEAFVISKIYGSKNISISKTKENFEDEKIIKNDDKYDGILTFFQLNLIMEGLFNPDFHPRKFFDYSSSETEIKEIDNKYTLNKFSRKIVTCLVNTKQYDEISSRTIELFVNNVEQSKFILFYDFIFKDSNITIEILRQFLKNISTDCLLDLKWDIESCRRALLSGMLNSVHKQDRLKQLESRDKDSKALHMDGANEAQLRGYAMLIAAKLPLILNVNRYLVIVYDSYENKKEREQIEFLFEDWSGLVQAIDENMSKLERAIEQSRMDILLLEQQQIRAEQETMAEIERVREKNGNISGGSDGGSSAIGENNNHIAMMAFLLAVLIFTKVAVRNEKGELVGEETYIVIFKFLFNWKQLIGLTREFFDTVIIYLIPIFIIVLALFIVAARKSPSLHELLLDKYEYFEKNIYLKLYWAIKDKNLLVSEHFNKNNNNNQQTTKIDVRSYVDKKEFKSIVNEYKSEAKSLKLPIIKQKIIIELRKASALEKVAFTLMIVLFFVYLSLHLVQHLRMTRHYNASLLVIQVLILSVAVFAIFWGGKILEEIERHKKDSKIKDHKKSNYYYEMDIRIQRPINRLAVKLLTRHKSFKYDIILSQATGTKEFPLEIFRDSYKAEYLNGNEIHHKIYFDCNIPLEYEELAKAYLTFEIIEQKRASDVADKGHMYLFNEFRFVCLTNRKLESKEISRIEEIVKQYFINQHLSYTYKLEYINKNLSIFS